MPPVIRPARKEDYSFIQNFTNSITYLHRHLDWRDTLEWLGRDPFWILEDQQEIQAVLACPPEPSEVAWVRLFAVGMHKSPSRAWNILFDRCLDSLQKLDPVPQVTTLALRDWYEDLIRRSGFKHHQDIVVYLFDTEPPPSLALPGEFHLREMVINDLPAVGVIDHMAFEPIWRLSSDDLLFAVKKSSFCTVIERGGEIVAYQMSSASSMYAHLARLAVRPDLQGQRLGYALVQHLLDHFLNKGSTWGVTLNTQSNNTASIRLYEKVGFRETGERFPVFLY
jgi:ribosomal protein S18 acetylase RimI-like enzyme